VKLTRSPLIYPYEFAKGFVVLPPGPSTPAGPDERGPSGEEDAAQEGRDLLDTAKADRLLVEGDHLFMDEPVPVEVDAPTAVKEVAPEEGVAVGLRAGEAGGEWRLEVPLRVTGIILERLGEGWVTIEEACCVEVNDDVIV
jgi:hypothetical protein